MASRKIIIQRTAEELGRYNLANLVRLACEFSCCIMIRHEDDQVNAKSLLGVLTFQLEPQMEVCITTKGQDAAQALEEICAWLS